MKESRFQNKLVFITGGSRGIGAAIAERFASEGADVVFTYSSSAQQAKTLQGKLSRYGVRCLALQVDNSDADALQQAIANIVQQLKPVDVLINNAGICPSGDFQELSLKDFDRIMDINVKAVFAASHAVSSRMSQGGRILSIGSNLADFVVFSDMVLYSTSKAALQGFTKGLARVLGPRKITVNLIQPGPIDTDMNPADTPHADFLRSRMALPDYGNVQDIASLAAFLASDEGKYVTGSIMTIDGGMNA